MGPFNESRQLKRAMTLLKKVEDKTCPKDMQALFKRKLRSLAMNETEYNARVVTIYKPLKRAGVIWD